MISSWLPERVSSLLRGALSRAGIPRAAEMAAAHTLHRETVSKEGRLILRDESARQG